MTPEGKSPDWKIAVGPLSDEYGDTPSDNNRLDGEPVEEEPVGMTATEESTLDCVPLFGNLDDDNPREDPLIEDAVEASSLNDTADNDRVGRLYGVGTSVAFKEKVRCESSVCCVSAAIDPLSHSL